MPVLLIIKRTISAPPLEVANVRIIVLWVQCSTDGDKFHGFYKSWSARTRKLLCCVHVSVSLFFLIVALSRVSLRLISEISIDQELLFRYCCQYIISPAFMWITSARVETISLWQHRQKQGTNEEANCVKPSERAKRWCATRRQGKKREGEKSTQQTTPQLRDKLR